ncbi:MAG: T9SS type A sorting domain-containing protein [Chitinophagales bacterium]
MKKIYILFFICFLSGKLFADDVTATIVNANTGLDNGSISLTLSAGIAPFTFSWTGPGGFTSTDQDINDLAPGEYCVTVTDNFCGVATVCAIVEEEPFNSIDDPLLSNYMVYPNPFNSEITISVSPSTDDEFTFIISDIHGKEIVKKVIHLSAGDQNVLLNLPSPIAMGSYRLSISCINQETVTGQLIHIK